MVIIASHTTRCPKLLGRAFRFGGKDRFDFLFVSEQVFEEQVTAMTILPNLNEIFFSLRVTSMIRL